MKLLRRSLLLLATLSLLLAPGCSSDSTGDTIGGTLCLSYTRATDPASGVVATVISTGGSCTTLVVELLITDVQDLFAADFVLDFGTSIVEYVGYSTFGSILSSDGTLLVEVVDLDAAAGEVAISIDRTSGAGGGINVVGQHRLLRLTFRKIANSGVATLSFTSGRMFDSQPAPIPGITWHGGNISLL